MYDVDDTIAAIATAKGGAARGILRVSGPGTCSCLERCFQTASRPDWTTAESAQVIPGHLATGAVLGEIPCEVYWWPTRRSYTHQPTAEIHMLGSPPLLNAALQAVCKAGARLAEPGEFTLRAFLAGRIDLTQAEAVLGVIDARGQQQLEIALTQLAGGLATPLHQVRSRLLDLLAHLEAGLDFVEEDIEFISADELTTQLSDSLDRIEALLGQLAGRSGAGGEPRLVLVGAPNVGKSSLLNALAGEATAIVSDVAGTTRDYVTKQVAIGGTQVLIADTAGVESVRPRGIQHAAQVMTQQQQQQADLILLCIDSSRAPTAWEQAQLQTVCASPRVVVFTKVDQRVMEMETPGISTSSVTGEGIEELRSELSRLLADAEQAVVPNTAARCHDSLRLAASSLQRARDMAARALGEELVAAEVRISLEELGKVVGTVYTDDILDRIFSRFCIGK